VLRKAVLVTVAAAAAVSGCGASPGHAPSARASTGYSASESAASSVNASTVDVSSSPVLPAPSPSKPTDPSPSPSPSLSPPASTAPPPATPCPTVNLRLSFGKEVGAGGTSYSYYLLTNDGSSTCSMRGYPRVAVLNAQGVVVQKPAVPSLHPGTSTPVRVTTVVLAPGQRAKFLVTSVDIVPNPDCPSLFRGTTLVVYPPNQTVPLRQPFDQRVGFCDLGVGPVERADS
jgi:Protein of unknown function (DUF4232)